MLSSVLLYDASENAPLEAPAPRPKKKKNPKRVPKTAPLWEDIPDTFQDSVNVGREIHEQNNLELDVTPPPTDFHTVTKKKGKLGKKARIARQAVETWVEDVGNGTEGAAETVVQEEDEQAREKPQAAVAMLPQQQSECDAYEIISIKEQDACEIISIKKQRRTRKAKDRTTENEGNEDNVGASTDVAKATEQKKNSKISNHAPSFQIREDEHETPEKHIPNSVEPGSNNDTHGQQIEKDAITASVEVEADPQLLPSTKKERSARKRAQRAKKEDASLKTAGEVAPNAIQHAHDDAFRQIVGEMDFQPPVIREGQTPSRLRNRKILTPRSLKETVTPEQKALPRDEQKPVLSFGHIASLVEIKEQTTQQDQLLVLDSTEEPAQGKDQVDNDPSAITAQKSLETSQPIDNKALQPPDHKQHKLSNIENKSTAHLIDAGINIPNETTKTATVSLIPSPPPTIIKAQENAQTPPHPLPTPSPSPITTPVSTLTSLSITDLRTLILANGSILCPPQTSGITNNTTNTTIQHLEIMTSRHKNTNTFPLHTATLVRRSGSATSIMVVVPGDEKETVVEALEALYEETETRCAKVLGAYGVDIAT